MISMIYAIPEESIETDDEIVLSETLTGLSFYSSMSEEDKMEQLTINLFNRYEIITYHKVRVLKDKIKKELIMDNKSAAE